MSMQFQNPFDVLVNRRAPSLKSDSGSWIAPVALLHSPHPNTLVFAAGY